MKTRKEILKELVRLSTNLDSIKSDLSKFSWDSEEELYIINKDDIQYILSRYLSFEIDNIQLEDWANAIEGREDIGYENEELEDIIFKLSNPMLHGEISFEQANIILSQK
jgi:hypothetical protein